MSDPKVYYPLTKIEWDSHDLEHYFIKSTFTIWEIRAQ